jgi:hypothetical protein
LTRSDPLIHMSVAGAVNGLLDFLAWWLDWKSRVILPPIVD